MEKQPLYCVRCWQITGAFTTGHSVTGCANKVRMTKRQIYVKFRKTP